MGALGNICIEFALDMSISCCLLPFLTALPNENAVFLWNIGLSYKLSEDIYIYIQVEML